MKAAIRRLLGTNRERIIAVVAATHEEAERGVRHALTAKSPLDRKSTRLNSSHG